MEQTQVMSAEFAKALVAARSKMGAVQKTKKNPAFGAASRYADLADILEEVTEPLAEEGISLFMPLVNGENNNVGVYIQMIYLSGESYQTQPFFIPISKPDAQGYIAASTYARRCYATSYFCLPTEDDDGNAASGTKVPQQPQQVQRPPQPPAKPAPPQVKEQLAVLKMVGAEVKDSELASEQAATMYLAKWDESYAGGKDGAGNILTRPEKDALMQTKKTDLTAEYNKLPAVLKAKAAKEVKQ